MPEGAAGGGGAPVCFSSSSHFLVGWQSHNASPTSHFVCYFNKWIVVCSSISFLLHIPSWKHREPYFRTCIHGRLIKESGEEIPLSFFLSFSRQPDRRSDSKQAALVFFLSVCLCFCLFTLPPCNLSPSLPSFAPGCVSCL